MRINSDHQNIRNDQQVLFLDDDLSFLSSLNRLFVSKNVTWKYVFVSNVEDAMKIIRAGKTDMLVSDIRMPGCDGFHMLKSLRENMETADLPVVMFSAYNHPRLKIKAIELGAVDLINKPVQADELVARINSILKQKQKFESLQNEKLFLPDTLEKHSVALESRTIEIILRLAKTVESRNCEDMQHLVRVGYSSKILAESLGLGKDFSYRILISSLLHDIGKIAIPDAVLLKKGKLTSKERIIMKSHCQLGFDILNPHMKSQSDDGMNIVKIISAIFDFFESADNDILKSAAEIALGHHEWFNGAGYPNGLTGERIPLSARIVMVADVYDSLRTKRMYKPAYTHAESMEIILKNNNTQFDPELITALINCADEFDKIKSATE
jgi:putative two-component system response regulator